MYRPLGQGDVDVAAMAQHLTRQGYDGWYVLEQNTILTEEPRDEGLVRDVHASVKHLRSALAADK
jgi:inosose dehydratase